jgi:hypothetical protein
MKITETRLRKFIRQQLIKEGYGDFARDPVVQDMLVDAGFNADGSFGRDGYPGPSDWQLYSPESVEEAAGWIQAALDMNQALKDAEAALNAGEFRTGQDAFYEIVYPVQTKYSKHGASDTEGREVAGTWLEDQGFEWS